MRRAVPRARLAATRSTGMLTRPNVMVPDQNARATGRSSSCSGNAALLCGGEASPERFGKRAGSLARFGLAQLDASATRLGLDQAEQPLPIFVVKLAGVEGPLESRHELL